MLTHHVCILGYVNEAEVKCCHWSGSETLNYQ